MTLLAQLIVTFAILSLESIGGANATLPEIHRQAVYVQHWMNDPTFVTLVAIGQAAPGPNVLVVSMIGWQVAGVPGLLAATAAIVTPSSLIALMVGRFTARHESTAWVSLTKRSLAPVAIGFMLASGIVMIRAAYQGSLSLAVAAVVAALIYFTSLSPVWTIAGGALVGIVGFRFHLLG